MHSARPSWADPGGGYPTGPGHAAGSETSAAAATAIEPVAGTLRARVLMMIRLSCRLLTPAVDPSGRWPSFAGPWNGLTDEEIEHTLNLKHQTASARRRELVLGGLIHDSGQTRKTTSGREATVWRAGAHPDPQVAEETRQDALRARARSLVSRTSGERLEAAVDALEAILRG